MYALANNKGTLEEQQRRMTAALTRSTLTDDWARVHYRLAFWENADKQNPRSYSGSSRYLGWFWKIQKSNPPLNILISQSWTIIWLSPVMQSVATSTPLLYFIHLAFSIQIVSPQQLLLMQNKRQITDVTPIDIMRSSFASRCSDSALDYITTFIYWRYPYNNVIHITFYIPLYSISYSINLQLPRRLLEINLLQLIISLHSTHGTSFNIVKKCFISYILCLNRMKCMHITDIFSII